MEHVSYNVSGMNYIKENMYSEVEGLVVTFLAYFLSSKLVTLPWCVATSIFFNHMTVMKFVKNVMPLEAIPITLSSPMIINCDMMDMYI